MQYFCFPAKPSSLGAGTFPSGWEPFVRMAGLTIWYYTKWFLFWYQAQKVFKNLKKLYCFRMPFKNQGFFVLFSNGHPNLRTKLPFENQTVQWSDTIFNMKTRLVQYSRDLNNEHLNNGKIWTTNFYLSCIQMSGIQMAFRYSDHHLNTSLVFKRWSEYRTKFTTIRRSDKIWPSD